MSKFIKIMGSILLIGIVFAVGGACFGGYKGIQVYNSKILVDDGKELSSNSYNIGDANKIKIDVSDAEKVEIVSSDEFKIETESYDLGDGKNSITYDVNDKVLSVKEEAIKNKINFGVGFFDREHKQKIKIYVPRDISLEDVTISSNSSDVEISDILLKRLYVKCDYGNIKTSNIKTEGDVLIEGDSGNIKFDNVSCSKLTTNCDYGNVKIDNGNIDKLNIDDHSGTVKITSNGLNSVDINSKYGNVELNTSEKDSLFNYKVESSYGNVKLNGDNKSTSFTRSTNAPKNINVKNDSGNISINTGK